MQLLFQKQIGQAFFGAMMIKFREKMPKGSSAGISGTSNLCVYFNSLLILGIVKLLKIRQTESLAYGSYILTFLLIFIEIYIINSIASGTFVFFYKRVFVLFLLTVVTFYFGRASLPYWSETEDDDED
ncbi:hypothetical protein RP300_01242 [Oligella urethralis]|nr:hypothetical protein RP300_01242 [Oligella urethralis]